MPNRFHTSQAWLTKRMLDHGAEDAVYERPGVGSIPIRVVFGSRREEMDSHTGALVYAKRPDFLISVKDVQELLTRPMHGDLIAVSLDGVIHTYEVTGDPAEDSSRFGLRWRVHTILIKVE